jgi:hypothetical protein
MCVDQVRRPIESCLLTHDQLGRKFQVESAPLSTFAGTLMSASQMGSSMEQKHGLLVGEEWWAAALLENLIGRKRVGTVVAVRTQSECL